MVETDPASEPAIVGLGGGGSVGSGRGADFEVTMAAHPRSAGSGDAVGDAAGGAVAARLLLGLDEGVSGTGELGTGLDWATQPAAITAVITSVATRPGRVIHFM